MAVHGATRLLYFAGARRLAEQDSSVGLLYVIFATTLAAKPHLAHAYVKQAYESSQSAKRLNPRLPAALATNLDTTGHRFDELVSLNGTKSLGLSGWAPRVAALASSPFELTLELDSTAMVCTAELHSVLLAAHRSQRIDFAVNFEASPFTRVGSKTLGPQPNRVEDVLPHNFALLVDRRGAGWAALHKRWLSVMKRVSDDQLALRLTLQQLAETQYVACDDQPLTAHLWQRLELFGARTPPTGTSKGCVHVRVARLTERVVGFKSADKTLPGWVMVPPRYTRPITGTALVVHSGHGRICDQVNRDAPRRRIVAQSLRKGNPFVSALNVSHCLRAMLPETATEGERDRRDARNDSLLTRRVCGQLQGGKGAPRAHDGLYEPLGAFWAWMCMQKLAGPKASCAKSKESQMKKRRSGYVDDA